MGLNAGCFLQVTSMVEALILLDRKVEPGFSLDPLHFHLINSMVYIQAKLVLQKFLLQRLLDEKQAR